MEKLATKVPPTRLLAPRNASPGVDFRLVGVIEKLATKVPPTRLLAPRNASPGVDFRLVGVIEKLATKVPPTRPLAATARIAQVAGRPARLSMACSSTLAPASIHSGFASSTSLWLMPSTQGTKIIEVGATCDR
jgi:hypothetical protein